MTKAQNEEFVEFGIPQYFQLLKRRWLPAGVTILLCTALSALIAIRSNRSIYESSGKLLFQSRDPQSELTGVGSDVSQFELDTLGRNNPLQNQANLLVSGLLLDEVIETLDMRDSFGELMSFHEVREGLIVKQIPDTDILQVSYQSGDSKFSANFVNTLMRSYLRYNSKNQKYNVDLARQFIQDQLPQAKSEFDRASRDLRNFKANNDVVTLEAKAREVSGLTDQTLQDTREAQLKLQSANTRAQALRQQLFQLSGTTKLSAVDLGKLNDSTAIQKTLSDIKAVEAEFQIQSEQYTADHPIIVDLRLKINSLNSVLNSQVSSVLGRTVSVDANSLQLSDLQKQLVAELSQVEVEKQSLQEEFQILSERKSSLGQGISNFANLEKLQTDLDQSLENSRKRYFQLLENLERLNQTEATLRESNQVQIIEAAVSSESPIVGFNLKIVLAGALLGTSLAFGLALLLDILDSRIKSIQQLEKLLGYSVLGTVPQHELSSASDDIAEFDSADYFSASPQRVIVLRNNMSSVYTSYQRIYVSLALLKHEKIPRVLGITSGLPREGKSEISANIAVTIAQAGQQVLLVDANFHSPAQHKFWKLENNAGLSSILQDSVNAKLVSQKVAPNLDVIVSGPIAPHTSITSHYSTFLSFISRVSQQYDCVIFDMGSVLSNPDVISLGKVCEGLLLVACLKQLQISEAISMRDMLTQADLPILGLIVNRFGKSEVAGEPQFSDPSSLLFSPTDSPKDTAKINIANSDV